MAGTDPTVIVTLRAVLVPQLFFADTFRSPPVALPEKFTLFVGVAVLDPLAKVAPLPVYDHS